MMEAEPLQPRKKQAKSVDSYTGNISKESEDDDAEEKAGELKKELYFDSAEVRRVFVSSMLTIPHRRVNVTARWM
jgi:hypothetical protein